MRAYVICSAFVLLFHGACVFAAELQGVKITPQKSEAVCKKEDTAYNVALCQSDIAFQSVLDEIGGADKTRHLIFFGQFETRVSKSNHVFKKFYLPERDRVTGDSSGYLRMFGSKSEPNLLIIAPKLCLDGNESPTFIERLNLNMPYEANSLILRQIQLLCNDTSGKQFLLDDSAISCQIFFALAYGCDGIGFDSESLSSIKRFQPESINWLNRLVKRAGRINNILSELKLMGIYHVPGRAKIDNQWIYSTPHAFQRWSRGSIPEMLNIKVSDGTNGFLLAYFTDKYEQPYFMIINANYAFNTITNAQGAVTIKFGYSLTKLEHFNSENASVETIELCDYELNQYVIDCGMAELFKYPGNHGFADHAK